MSETQSSQPSENTPQSRPSPSRRMLTVQELTARERALSDLAEQQKKKRREDQQAAWREEIEQGEYENLAGIFVDIHRDIERLRAKGDLTEHNRKQAFQIDHWVTEYRENLRLWKTIRSNLDRLVSSLGQKTLEQAIETLREVRPEGVAPIEQAAEKQEVLSGELKRLGIQILDEKSRMDEEVQSNLWEDRTVQNAIHQMVRRVGRKKALEVVEEVRAATRQPLEERLVRLKAVHSTLQRSLTDAGEA